MRFVKVSQIGPTFLVPGKTVIIWGVKSCVPYFHTQNEEKPKELACVYAYMVKQ